MTFIKGKVPLNTGRTRFKKRHIPWNKGLEGYNKDYPRSKECHKNFHKIYGKINNTKEQLEEFLKY